MRNSNRGKKHSYQLVLAEDGRGSERRIEFEASGTAAALLLAQRQCAGRRAELFEDGRSLGGLQNRRNGGFWIISPSRDPHLSD
jgi:hypothetical protein